ncbi:transcriptional regulator [Opitutaceae bacterium TAV1]|nr:transcriptional regulator [Opitutaceae bacterium TAV1]
MNTFISDVHGPRPAAKSPTLRDVAKAAGVSLASASYALRGHPTVSEATRRHVAAVAAQAGYRPNPQLAAFMQARRTGRSMRTDATVALVYGGPSLPAEGESYFGLCLRGIRPVATDRGYAIDPLRWDEARDPDASRLRRILDQRGIRGLLLMPADRTSRWTLPLDWSRFFGVALDLSIRGVPVHRVADHHSADMLTALTRVKAAGWRRPGLVLDPLNNERTCEMRLGAYLARTHRDFPEAPPPLLVPAGEDRVGRLRAWLRRHCPDVVLSPDRGIPSLLPLAGRAGACAFVSLANYTDRTPWPGIFIDGEGVGRTAAFLLFSLLENPQTAAALRPQTILVEGRWHDAT